MRRARHGRQILTGHLCIRRFSTRHLCEISFVIPIATFSKDQSVFPLKHDLPRIAPKIAISPLTTSPWRSIILSVDPKPSAHWGRPFPFLSSSMAEHSAVNRRVVGSSPTWGARDQDARPGLFFAKRAPLWIRTCIGSGVFVWIERGDSGRLADTFYDCQSVPVRKMETLLLTDRSKDSLEISALGDQKGSHRMSM